MNCKEGDIAIVIRSRANNLGKIVKCVRPATAEDIEYYWMRIDKGPAWIVEGNIITRGGYKVPLAFDSDLKPLPGAGLEDDVMNLKEVENVK